MPYYKKIEDLLLAESPEQYGSSKSKAYKRLYTTGNSINGKAFPNPKSYVIRIGYEEQDMSDLPPGTYWWQDENGKVQKIIKE